MDNVPVNDFKKSNGDADLMMKAVNVDSTESITQKECSQKEESKVLLETGRELEKDDNFTKMQLENKNNDDNDKNDKSDETILRDKDNNEEKKEQKCENYIINDAEEEEKGNEKRTICKKYEVEEDDDDDDENVEDDQEYDKMENLENVDSNDESIGLKIGEEREIDEDSDEKNDEHEDIRSLEKCVEFTEGEKNEDYVVKIEIREEIQNKNSAENGEKIKESADEGINYSNYNDQVLISNVEIIGNNDDKTTLEDKQNSFVESSMTRRCVAAVETESEDTDESEVTANLIQSGEYESDDSNECITADIAIIKKKYGQGRGSVEENSDSESDDDDFVLNKGDDDDDDTDSSYDNDDTDSDYDDEDDECEDGEYDGDDEYEIDSDAEVEDEELDSDTIECLSYITKVDISNLKGRDLDIVLKMTLNDLYRDRRETLAAYYDPDQPGPSKEPEFFGACGIELIERYYEKKAIKRKDKLRSNYSKMDKNGENEKMNAKNKSMMKNEESEVLKLTDLLSEDACEDFTQQSASGAMHSHPVTAKTRHYKFAVNLKKAEHNENSPSSDLELVVDDGNAQMPHVGKRKRSAKDGINECKRFKRFRANSWH